jgi:protein-tyrosine-phosphatase
MPDNTIALELVEAAQCAIAAPSANLEGKKPPTTCQEALEDLDGRVDLAIDGGPVELGVSSSIVDFTQEPPKVIRDGVISQYEVDRTIQKRTVLFVCTGNSCRSVMADYLLKDLMRDRKDVEVLSAGTSVLFRQPASAETISVLKERGIDASRHLSRPVGSLMLKKSDLIFVMTRAHRMQVLDIAPEVEKRVYLLREFSRVPKGQEMDLDIPDPIGKPHESYAECLLTIQEAITKIVQLI